VAVELAEDTRGGGFIGASGGCAIAEPWPPVLEDGVLFIGPTMGAPEFFGLGRRKPGNVDGNLIELVLEEDYAEGALEGGNL